MTKLGPPNTVIRDNAARTCGAGDNDLSIRCQDHMHMKAFLKADTQLSEANIGAETPQPTRPAPALGHIGTATLSSTLDLDHDACYRVITVRDARFDGRLFTGVKTTGIYCRPICPARTPRS